MFSVTEIGIAFPELSQAKISSSLYGDFTISDIKPKKLFRSSNDGSAEPSGCECAIPI